MSYSHHSAARSEPSPYSVEQYAYPEDHLLWEDNLKNGMWPRSFTFWVVAFWMALLVIRPWERLVPELAAIRLELTYSIFAILVVGLTGQIRLRPALQTRALLVWIAALTICTFTALNFPLAWNDYYRYLTMFVFYFILLSVIRTPYQLLFFIAAFVVVVGTYMAKAQWEHFIHGAYGYSMGVRRLRGIDVTYSHPNSVAASATIALPFVALLWKIREDFTAAWPRWWRRKFPWILWFTLYILISSVVLTNSRSGMLGVILAVILWSTKQNTTARVGKRLLWALMLLIVVWIFMPDDTWGRFQNIWNPESGPAAEVAHNSAQGRIEGFKQGLEMFRRYPLTGVGLGNFISYRTQHLDGVHLVAHNIAGGVLGEMGLVGALAFSFFIAAIFITNSRLRQLSNNYSTPTLQIMREVGIATSSAVILLLFLGLFGDMQSRIHLYWFAAICALAYQFAVSNAISRSELPNETYS